MPPPAEPMPPTEIEVETRFASLQEAITVPYKEAFILVLSGAMALYEQYSDGDDTARRLVREAHSADTNPESVHIRLQETVACADLLLGGVHKRCLKWKDVDSDDRCCGACRRIIVRTSALAALIEAMQNEPHKALTYLASAYLDATRLDDAEGHLARARRSVVV